MDPTDILLIVGAGNAGAELAFGARLNGWLGGITLIGDEVHLPYHRPPLSKQYLSGKADAGSLAMRPIESYEKASITLELGRQVTSIDRTQRELVMADGERLDYTKLALCLGSRARLMSVEGLDTAAPPANVHYLRTRADADALRDSLKPGRRLVIVGGGYVGLEVAASARALGAEVTVLEAQPRVLARVTGPEVSAFYEAVHREHGVDLRTATSLARVECDPATTGTRRLCAVVTAEGERIEVDALIVGVGGMPNVELAAAAGLEVDNGIVVNEFAQSSDRHIYAAGDCACRPSPLYGRTLRLESVPNALEQARAAAASLCGKGKVQDPVPWFWSDQYDLKLQMAGLAQGHDRFVLRGSMQSRSFTAFYLRGQRLLAADCVNRPGDFMIAKRLVAAGQAIDAERLGDESVPLKTSLSAPG